MWISFQALSLCDHHVSLYQLTIEKGTPLHKDVKAGKVVHIYCSVLCHDYGCPYYIWSILLRFYILTCNLHFLFILPRKFFFNLYVESLKSIQEIHFVNSINRSHIQWHYNQPKPEAKQNCRVAFYVQQWYFVYGIISKHKEMAWK